jgi:hypothetical protein
VQDLALGGSTMTGERISTPGKRDAEHQALVTFDDLPERLRIAPATTLHQLGIRNRQHPSMVVTIPRNLTAHPSDDNRRVPKWFVLRPQLSN